MKFLAVPLAEAEGQILGHNVIAEGGRRLLRKGQPLSAADLATLAQRGVTSVYVARLAPDDVGEDRAARRIAAAVAGSGVRLSAGAAGRVNFLAEELSVLRVDRSRLGALNALDGVALATLAGGLAVPAGKLVATLKVVPYALPETVVAAAERGGGEPGQPAAIVELEPLRRRRTALIVHGVPASEGKLLTSFEKALGPRLAALGSPLASAEFVAFDALEGEERLAAAIGGQLDAGTELLLLAGETAIMDRDDVAPRAILAAGGTIEAFGAPVDPGNLLLLAYRGPAAIIGAPGCARSPQRNIVDLVLPRLLVGERLDQAAICELGYGGLLEEVAERGQPRLL
jgi:molybdenum cofactor cytidylyltransferase